MKRNHQAGKSTRPSESWSRSKDLGHANLVLRSPPAAYLRAHHPAGPQTKRAFWYSTFRATASHTLADARRSMWSSKLSCVCETPFLRTRGVRLDPLRPFGHNLKDTRTKLRKETLKTRPGANSVQLATRTRQQVRRAIAIGSPLLQRSQGRLHTHWRRCTRTRRHDPRSRCCIVTQRHVSRRGRRAGGATWEDRRTGADGRPRAQVPISAARDGAFLSPPGGPTMESAADRYDKSTSGCRARR